MYRKFYQSTEFWFTLLALTALTHWFESFKDLKFWLLLFVLIQDSYIISRCLHKRNKPGKNVTALLTTEFLAFLYGVYAIFLLYCYGLDLKILIIYGALQISLWNIFRGYSKENSKSMVNVL